MNKRYSAGAEPNAGTLRLRVPHANGLELTLVVPHLDFYGMLRSHGPGHQLVITVRGEHWSQYERNTTGLFPGLATSRVVYATTLAGPDALKVDWSLSTGGRAGIRTTTTIDSPGRFSWRSFGRGGAGRGAGRVMDGRGEGVDGVGQPYTWEVSGNRTTVVIQLSSGGSRTAVTTESSWGSNTTWVTKDDSGAPVGTGSYTEDTQSGSWSKSTSTADGSGGTITTNSSGGPGSSSHEKVHTDASGEVVESDRSVTTTGENVSSTVSSSVDGDTGNVTITTTSKDSDGTEYVHVTESDASGNTIRDDTTVTGPGAQPPAGPGNNPGGGGAGDGDSGSGDPGSGDPSGDPDGGDDGGATRAVGSPAAVAPAGKTRRTTTIRGHIRASTRARAASTDRTFPAARWVRCFTDSGFLATPAAATILTTVPGFRTSSDAAYARSSSPRPRGHPRATRATRPALAAHSLSISLCQLPRARSTTGATGQTPGR